MAKRKEVLVLGEDGTLTSEMFGFNGKDCFKAAAAVAKELEGLGVYTEVLDIHTKGVVDAGAATHREEQKVEERRR